MITITRLAAAKDAKLFDEAVDLANTRPCDPKTLTRAARDFAKTNPAFAVEAGLAALGWLVRGYGYEVTRKLSMTLRHQGRSN